MTTGSTPGSGMPMTPATAGAAAEPTRPLGRNMQTVATFPDYASAQRAVDFLSDEKFPVERTAIVGTNLRLVENVLGRMTTGRAGAGRRGERGLVRPVHRPAVRHLQLGQLVRRADRRRS